MHTSCMHCTALHALQLITWRDVTSHDMAFHHITSHQITLHHITSICIASRHHHIHNIHNRHHIHNIHNIHVIPTHTMPYHDKTLCTIASTLCYIRYIYALYTHCITVHINIYILQRERGCTRACDNYICLITIYAILTISTSVIIRIILYVS